MGIKAALPLEGARDDPLQRKPRNAGATMVINAHCQHPLKETGQGSADPWKRFRVSTCVWGRV